MRLALQGLSGSLIGRDYRGQRVLAAYEPVEGLELGFLAKVNMSELRAQFFSTSIILAFLTIFLVAFGAWLISKKIIKPTLQSLGYSEDQFHPLVNNIPGISYRCKLD